METSVLVLIMLLSVTLIVFLIFAIILFSGLIKLTNSLRQIAEKADGIVDNVEAAAATFRSVAGPLTAGKFIMNIVDMVSNKSKKGKH